MALIVVLTGAWGGVPGPAAAQQATSVRVEENFRAEPNGEVLARLLPGAPVTLLERRDSWARIRMEGWVWTRSLQVARREGLDLVVSASEGENLRGEPSGAILGRLERGMLLGEVERRPGWIRVRREGWIWAPSLAAVSTASSSGAPQPSPRTEPPGGARSGEVSGGARSDTASGAAVPRTPPSETSGSRRSAGFTLTGRSGATVLTAPDGDTLGTVRGARELEVLGRQGNWARVRLEGWTWLPPAADSAAAAQPQGGAPLTPADLVAAPQAHRGRVVTWSLQFISLEKAERVRTDFLEGEPFLLTRFGGTGGPFVYVAVPPEHLQAVAGLVPLETLDVTGRIRTGASALTRTPILDLISLRRASSR